MGTWLGQHHLFGISMADRVNKLVIPASIPMKGDLGKYFLLQLQWHLVDENCAEAFCVLMSLRHELMCYCIVHFAMVAWV